MRIGEAREVMRESKTWLCNVPGNMGQRPDQEAIVLSESPQAALVSPSAPGGRDSARAARAPKGPRERGAIQVAQGAQAGGEPPPTPKGAATAGTPPLHSTCSHCPPGVGQ